MNRSLHHQIQQLREQAVAMAEAVQQALLTAVSSLVEADTDAARRVVQGDTAINDQRFRLENEAVKLIATQQPVAIDVRLLIGVLEITSELERMGDYAKEIANTTINQSGRERAPIPESLPKMAEIAVNMLKQAMHAFAQDDHQLATAVACDDDAVDQLCTTTHRTLVEQALAEPSTLEKALQLFPVIHSVERFADRTTNICERIVYIATGEQIEFS